MKNKHRKQNKRDIKGRSMTEMIGTLTIMGILSILVIKAYRYAWDTATANEIISTVAQMAVTASTQLDNGNTISLHEFGDKVAGQYPFTVNAAYGENLFSIRMQDIPYGVCNRIQSYKWEVPKIAKYGDVANGECPDDEGNVEFVFQRTLEK